MSDFKKLQVWQKAHALALAAHRVALRIKGSLYSSLRSQVFRAAMSIPANIAEGRRQKSEKEFARFLGYALNSSTELEHHLILARDTQVIPETDFVSLLAQTITVRKMLYGLIKRLSETDPLPSKSTQPSASSSRHPAGSLQ